MVRIAVRFCGGFSLLCIARVRPGRRDQRTCLMQLSCRRQISAIHSAILGVIKRHSPPRPRLSRVFLLLPVPFTGLPKH